MPTSVIATFFMANDYGLNRKPRPRSAKGQEQTPSHYASGHKKMHDTACGAMV